MLVRERMISPVITARAETALPEAAKIMREHNIRRLPVVNKHHQLIGIISDRDIRHAAPSRATSLSIWEVNHLLQKLLAKEIMSVNLITVSPETPIQKAAQLMVDHKIGGLPVVDSNKHLVGIITETDIFKVFVELFSKK